MYLELHPVPKVLNNIHFPRVGCGLLSVSIQIQVKFPLITIRNYINVLKSKQIRMKIEHTLLLKSNVRINFRNFYDYLPKDY